MTTLTTGVATSFIDFTRASNATVTDSDGKVKWAPHNLLTNSENFDAASWTKAGTCTVTANTAAAPNGTTTADTITLGSGVAVATQNITLLSGVSYTLGMWVRSVSGTAVFRLTYFDGSSSVISSDFTATTTWQLFTHTVTGSGAAGNVGIREGSATAAATLYAWGAHLYRSDLAMQPNTSAYPIYNPTTPKNLLGYTESFESQDTIVAGAWTYASITVAANSVTGPNGLQTADLITATSTGSGISQVFASVASRTYTLSVYAKAGTITSFDMGGTNQGVANYWARFDLSAVTATNISGGTTPSIVAVGNGWYRCSLQKTVTAGNSNDVFSIFIGNRAATVSGNAIYLWGAQLSDSASLDSYSPVYGAAVTSAAYYGPRRDFDGATLACKGLLVEEQRVNLINLSGFTNGVTDAGTRGGLLTATSFYSYLTNTSLAFGYNGSTATYAYNAWTPAASTAYTFSTFVRMDDGNAPSFLSATATAATNDFVVVVGGTIANMTTATVTNMGSSIYRVAVSVTTGGSPISGIGVLKYETNSSRPFRVTGYQLEAGSFATSYIPTGSATATRNADVASVSTQAFPYSATEGTVVFNGTLLSTATSTKSAWQLYLSANERILVLADNGGSALRHLGFVGGTPVAIMDGSTVQNLKDAVAYKLNDYAASTNGAAVVPDTTATVPAAASALEIGTSSGNPALNGWVKQITYIPRRLSNAELQSRSA